MPPDENEAGASPPTGPRPKPISRLLIEMAEGMLGRAPVRFGARPKALLPFRADHPFAKVTSPWFALPGEGFTGEGYTPNRVEVLGSGQQFVSHARHPSGYFYRWTRGDPLDIPRADLPSLTEDKAHRFAAAADKVFTAAGCIHVERDPATKRWRKVEAKVQAKVQAEMAGRRDQSDRQPSAWKSMNLDHLARKIDPRGRQLAWGWHLRCPAHQDRNPVHEPDREERVALLEMLRRLLRGRSRASN